MKKLNLEIEINATPENVWDSVVNKTKYNRWTSAFQETSHFEGGWNKGDKIRFLGFNAEGQKMGMVSEIAESRFPEYISIKHLGNIFNGIEDFTSEEVKKWAPSFENYTIERTAGNTAVFKLDMVVPEDYYDMFMQMWPNALNLLKQVSEESAGTKITISALINAELQKVWDYWTGPAHIVNWNFASDDWHCPFAENDLRENGKFRSTMASRDGKMSFDFEGVYSLVKHHEVIQYRMADGREVQVWFSRDGNATRVTETFDAENVHPVELQRNGWQSIMNNFKKYVEK
jgi:uncharacterized protein YndB with AHSA1/START domain